MISSHQKALIFIILSLASIFLVRYVTATQLKKSSVILTNEEINRLENIKNYGSIAVADKTPITPEIQNYINEFRKIVKGLGKFQDVPRSIVADYYEKIGPNRMLDVVDENPFCHEEGHNIGKEIYEKTQHDLTLSLDICERRCADACFHGVLMEMLAPGEKNNENHHTTFEEVASQIPSVCEKEEFKNKNLIGTCAHRLGHILLILDNYKFDRPLAACEKFQDSRLIDWCATGVFMEENTVLGKEDIKKPGWYPCDKYPAHANACLRYKVEQLYTGKTEEAKTACLSETNINMRRSCFAGIGFMNMPSIAFDPALLPSVCNTGDLGDQRACVEAPAGLIALEVPDRARLACSYLSNQKLKSYCLLATKMQDIGLTMTLDMHLGE